MLTVLTLLALLVVAYLLAHFVMDRLQARFLFTTGGEYILLGVLIGPEVPELVAALLDAPVPWSGFVDRDSLRLLAPLVSLAIGWAGLVYGLQLDLRRLITEPGGAARLVGLQVLMSFGLVFLASRAVLLHTGFLEVSRRSATQAALFLGASAAVSSPAAFELVRRRFAPEGRHTALLARALHLDEVLAVAVFGLVFAFYHPTGGGFVRGLTPTEWYVVTLALGGIMGLVFHFFLGPEQDEDKVFLAFTGIVVFVSGTAWYLSISPLLVSLVLGVVLGNSSARARAALPVILRTNRPMVLMLLIFAGALWTRVAWPAFVLAALYVSTRFAGKLAGGWLASLASAHDLRRDVGRGILGHGEVAVAMALNMRLVYEGPVIDWAFTTVLVSVVVNEIWSARLLKGLLIDGGDIRASVAPAEGGT